MDSNSGTENDTSSSLSSSTNALIFATICIIGYQVEVYVKEDSVYSGIFHTVSFEDANGVVLKEAKLTEKGKADTNVTNGSVIETLVIPSAYLVRVVAKGILFPCDTTVFQDLRRIPESVKQQDHAGRIDGTSTTKEFKLNPEAKDFCPYARARPTTTPTMPSAPNMPYIPEVGTRPYAPHPYDNLTAGYGQNPQHFVGGMGEPMAYAGVFPPLAASQIMMKRHDQVVYLPITQDFVQGPPAYGANQGPSAYVAYHAPLPRDFVQGAEADQAIQTYVPPTLIANDPYGMPGHVLQPPFPLNRPEQIPSPKRQFDDNSA